MATIWFRKSKNAYYLQIGRNRQKRLGKTKAEAETAYRRWLIEQGESLSQRDRNKLTVAELAQEFLDYSKANNDSATYDFYCVFVVPFVERFGSAPAADFPPLSFTKWLDEHKGWKASRRNAIVAVKRLFNFAVENKLLADNPLKSVKKPAKRKKNRILSSTERHLLLSSIKDRQFRRFCLALLETGARPISELARVTAAHVSGDCTMWVFDQHKTDATGEVRIIYLAPAMQALTKVLMEEYPEGPLFPSTRHKEDIQVAWTRNAVRLRFRRLRDRHPELKSVTAYVLRHTFSTQALINGVPVPVVAALLGHKSIRMVDEHYSHVEQVAGKLHEAVITATRQAGCA